MPSILPLVILSHHGYAQPAAAAAALSLVVVCHMLSNVTNTLFDFKTGQSYCSDFIDANVALEPCCCIRCYNNIHYWQVLTQFTMQMIVSL